MTEKDILYETGRYSPNYRRSMLAFDSDEDQPAFGYKQAEQVIDTERWTTEFFIDTPNGRMSVRMPNFLSNAEQQRRVKVVVEALNGNG